MDVSKNDHRRTASKTAVQDGYKNDIIYCILQTRSDLCIPRNETVRPRSQFPHSCIRERIIYSQDQSTYLLQQKKQTDIGKI
jgi:hypothetical protein